MNIHEHQAKDILKEFGAPVSEGIVIFSEKEIRDKILKLKDKELPIVFTLNKFDEPAQRYCPAGVYEIQKDNEDLNPKFIINAQNCIHCKTCDIKEPSQNIDWVTPEGTGGPNYANM